MDYNTLSTPEYLILIAEKIQAIYPADENTFKEIIEQAESMSEEDLILMEINLKAFLPQFIGDDVEIPLTDRKSMIELIDINATIQLN
jgi:hypothetical protein